MRARTVDRHGRVRVGALVRGSSGQRDVLCLLELGRLAQHVGEDDAGVGAPRAKASEFASHASRS